MFPIENFNIFFKGFVDAVVKVGDTYHLFDWKTCSWGWDSRKKAEKLVTYQLTRTNTTFLLSEHKTRPPISLRCSKEPPKKTVSRYLE